MKTPTVYVVQWPDFEVLKVGFSSVRRWKRFLFSGAEVVHLYEAPSTSEGFAVEEYLHDVARDTLEWAFDQADDLARNLLGNNGSGYAECYRGSASDAEALIAEAMHRADAQACAQASDPSTWHGRTDVTDGLRTASPTRANTSSVTRGRAYGFPIVGQIETEATA